LSDDGWWDSGSPGPEPEPDPYGQGRRRAPQQPQQPQGPEYGQQPYTRGQHPPQGPRPDQRAQPQPDYTAPSRYPAPPEDWTDPRTGGQPRQQPRQPQQPSGGHRGGYGQDPYARPRPPQQPRPPRPPQPSADPYASDSYPSDPYSSGSYEADPYTADPYASGSYRPTGRDGYPAAYPTGGYPAEEPAPRRSQRGTPDPDRPDTYDTGESGRGRGRRGTGSHERPDVSGGYQRPAAAEPGGSRRRAAGPPDEYGAEEPGAYETGSYDTGSYATGGQEPRGRSRRRSASNADEPDYDQFSLMDDEDGERDNPRGRSKPKQRRGRNCLAVFLAFSVLAGGLGYGGYKGYTWYHSKYGPPPDYVSTAGDGAKTDVVIPTGSVGTAIGGILFNDGVVKSQRAFTDACNANPQCTDIFAGTYLLPKQISAAAAVTALLNPANQDSKSQLITYGGERAATIFAQLESKTGWKDSAVVAAINSGKIDLPSWDAGKAGTKFPYAHIEGFIATETYVLTAYSNPAALLKKMVDDQLTMFNQVDLAAKAQAMGHSEYDTLIIASMARAEAGSNTSDLNKIAGVIYNRLKDTAQFAHLGFDTVTLYGMGNTTTTPDNADRSNPYNTSVDGIEGLPPSPIDNPDQPSVAAALDPQDATDYYFCATDAGVQYAATNAEWQELGQKYPGLCGD
jgi:UPF0755 protein